MSENDDTETIRDNFEVIIESEEECNCGMMDILNNKKYHILLQIKETQSFLDKLLGKLELIEELLNDEDEDENEDEDDF